jgi:tRNA-2-methylthio-N6-dimethylallyladenosine synthase
MARKYLIETFGCQMNVHDSERMAGLLDQAGYEPTTDDAEADVVVINTCSVREHAEDKLYTRLGELRVLGEETGHRPVVAVAGCVAQQEGASLLKRTNGHVIDVIVGTQRVKQLPMLIERTERSPFAAVEVAPWDDVSFPLGITRRMDPVRAYITIIEGCNDHCSFCVVPHTRGRERMRTKAEILAEVREAAASGRREVQLLGQIVNHYQAPDDAGCDFAQLLAEVHEVAGIERIRFASPHPRHTGPRVIAALRDLPKVCKHLHLPAQSGSTAVLQGMRRRYSRESYLDLIAEVRAAVPGIRISTDLIVGFPGETAEAFEATMTLVEAVRFSSIFSFAYSPRPNTLAALRMPDNVPDAEKTRRLQTLQARQRDIQIEQHAAEVGSTVDVLIDAASRRRETEVSGRTSGNTVVNLPVPGGASDVGAWIGRTVPVTIRRAGAYSLWGEALDADSGV